MPGILALECDRDARHPCPEKWRAPPQGCLAVPSFGRNGDKLELFFRRPLRLSGERPGLVFIDVPGYTKNAGRCAGI